MRAVLQRVANASVTIDGDCVAAINERILALIGINEGDSEETCKYIIKKLTNMRIFEDEDGKMNLSARDKGYGLLLVPNFTIYADATGSGRRPSFARGAKPEEARETFDKLVKLAKEDFGNVQAGIFQADMKVQLLNDGPITILLDSDKKF
jgi:D-tyrosyl-tRNA(Tyr) deacylase